MNERLAKGRERARREREMSLSLREKRQSTTRDSRDCGMVAFGTLAFRTVGITSGSCMA